MELSEDQKKVHDYMVDFVKGNDSLFILGGFAGTGKTFLLSQLKKTLEKENPKIKIAFVSFTGKAASVLAEKIGYISSNSFCGTIHSLIYCAIYKYSHELKKPVIVSWEKVDSLEYDLIIIDEASMVSEEIFNDLKSYKIPIICVGDHGQLPPISYSNFSLMSSPDYKLENIHRQAEDNPIIKLSIDARLNAKIDFGVYSPHVAKLPKSHPNTWKIFDNINWSEDAIILCAFNKTRVSLNNKIRDKLGYLSPEPYPGERVICLKNNKSAGIYNGQIGTLMLLTYAAPDICEATIMMDGVNDFFDGFIYIPIFGKETYENIYQRDENYRIRKSIRGMQHSSVNYYDFGYTITAHKAQGSEWSRVVVFEEKNFYSNDESYYSKWLYTAVTRARDRLLIISDY